MVRGTERWVVDWYTLEVDGEELHYPALPADLAHEHFDRHRETVSPVHTHEQDGTLYHRTVEAGGRVEAREATLTYTVMNRMQQEEDVLRVDADFPDPELAPADPDGYAAVLREDRVETLLDDVEAVYEAARTAAYMVPEVRDGLVESNHAPDDLTLEGTVERARETAQGYYGDMPADTLITPLAWYLEDGREGRVAPFRYAFTGSERKQAKEGKGLALIDTYYDVVQDCVAILHE